MISKESGSETPPIITLGMIFDGYNYVIDSSKEKAQFTKLNLSLLVRFQGLESSLVVMIIRLEIKLSSIIVRQLEVTPSAKCLIHRRKRDEWD